MQEMYFSDDGIMSSSGSISAEEAVKLGRAAATLSKHIIIGIKGSFEAKALSLSFSAGAAENGADVFFMGEASLPELFFCSDIAAEDDRFLIVYISFVFSSSVRFFRKNGSALSFREEEQLLSDDISSKKDFSGRINDISSLRCLYLSKLRSVFSQLCFDDFPYSVMINSPSSRIRKLFSEFLPELKGDNTLSFHINEDGVKVTAFTEQTGYVPCDKLLSLALKHYISEKAEDETVFVPKDFPGSAEKIAGVFGKKILRCEEVKLPFFYDKIILIVEILKIIQKTGQTLDTLCADLPEYAELDRYIPIKRENGIETIKKLCREYNNGKIYNIEKKCRDGITITDDLGRISVTPVRSGKGIMLHAESKAMETAAELCDIYESILRKSNDFS